MKKHRGDPYVLTKKKVVRKKIELPKFGKMAFSKKVDSQKIFAILSNFFSIDGLFENEGFAK